MGECYAAALYYIVCMKQAVITTGHGHQKKMHIHLKSMVLVLTIACRHESAAWLHTIQRIGPPIQTVVNTQIEDRVVHHALSTGTKLI